MLIFKIQISADSSKTFSKVASISSFAVILGEPALLSRLSWEVLELFFLCCVDAHQLAGWCWMKQTLIRFFFFFFLCSNSNKTNPYFSCLLSLQNMHSVLPSLPLSLPHFGLRWDPLPFLVSHRERGLLVCFFLLLLFVCLVICSLFLWEFVLFCWVFFF